MVDSASSPSRRGRPVERERTLTFGRAATQEKRPARIRAGYVVAITVNVGYLAYDRGWFKSLCQIGLGGISMAVVVRMYRVFPFNFGHSQFDWTWTARFVLVLAMVGVGVGIVVELVKLVTDLLSSGPDQHDSPVG